MATISGTSVTVDSGIGVAYLADQNKRMRLSHDIDEERFLKLYIEEIRHKNLNCNLLKHPLLQNI